MRTHPDAELGAATSRSCWTGCARRSLPAWPHHEVADPDVEGIAWDLEPLLDGAGEGAAGVEALLDDAQRRADAFAAEHAGKVAELDGAGLAAAMRELATLQELIGRAGSYAMLRFATATADPERGALLQLVQERGDADRDDAAVLRARVGRARRRRTPRRCSPTTGSTSAATTCAPRAATGRTCCPSRRSGSSPRSRSPRSSAWTRLFEEQTSAIEVDAARRRRAGRARGRARRACSPRTARSAATAAEAVTGGARARACASRGYVLNTLLADKTVDDRLRRYPHWLAAATSPTRRPTSRCRRSSRRCAAATRSRGAGTGSRRSCSASTGSPTTTAWRRSTDDEREIAWADAQGHRARLVRRLLAASSADTARAFFDERWIDAPGAPRQARRRVLLLHACRAQHPYVLLN